MGEDKKTETKQLTAALSNKWDREYLETCGYVQDRLSLNLVCDFIFLVLCTYIGEPWKTRDMPPEKVEASKLEMRV